MSAHADERAAFATLAGERSLLTRSSTVERVAEILRDKIIEGVFRPGARLSEDAIGNALGVSRNTLRESFRLLSHERLVVHELNRGMFVRTLSADDVVDLYRMRRVVEPAALENSATASAELFAGLRAAVDEGERAAVDARWPDVGTANMRFHQALTALAQSFRLDMLIRQILAELRLVFHVMDNPSEFHKPYLKRNREIVSLLEAGEIGQAREALIAYLNDAEQQLLEAY